MKIVLLNNHSVLNAGDHAILLETLAVLDAAFPHAEIMLVFNDVPPAAAAHPERTVIGSPLSMVVTLNVQREYVFAPPASRRAIATQLLQAAVAARAGRTLVASTQQTRFVAALAEADLVLACGGGYMYAPAAEGLLGWFDFTMLGCLLTMLLGKPLILLPQSFGPLHSLRQRLVVAAVARYSRLAFAREAISHDFLRSIGAGARALPAPDLAFAMKAAPSLGSSFARAANDRAASFHVGITALNWAGQNFTFDAQGAYEAALLQLIDTIVAEGGTPVLFAQCCGPSAAEDDRVVARRLHAAARHPEQVRLVDRPLPPHELQAAYSTMDYFVGTRMHSVILALNGGVPALAVGYLHKTRGMLAQLGLEQRGLDIANLTGTELEAAFAGLRAAPQQPAVAPYLARARRFKQALAPLLQIAAGAA
jgi:colanic acid/amylovoran biosynthesis protein